MDEIGTPANAGSAGEPVPAPASWPVPAGRATGLRNIPRRALTISLATTALVVVGGVVVAAAVAASPDGNGPTFPAPSAVSPDGQPMAKGGRMHLAGPMQALHGEYVVSDGNGGYRTEEMQRGAVTAVNGSTFTVKSDDGYTHDWVTDANTRQPGTRMRMMPKDNGGEVPAPPQGSSALTTGQTVMVVGTKDGDTYHAVRVMQMRQGGMERGQKQDGQQQNGPTKVPFGGGRGQFGHRFGGGGGGMPGGQMPDGQMPDGQMPSAPVPSAPAAPDTSAPDSSPTPTQTS